MTEPHYQKEFHSVDFTSTKVAGEYEDCQFVNCNFQTVDLKQIVFDSCTFSDCDFHSAKTLLTAFRDVAFYQCRLEGIQFNSCNTFRLSMRFESCSLKYSSFYQLNMNQTQFISCELGDVDFEETLLSRCLFDNCSLENSIFLNSDLSLADISTSRLFSISPEKNKIEGLKVSRHDLSGLLTQYKLDIIS
ncbi:MAG: pentapeptide repeat-containing protein [Flavobacteriales bacterium]